MGDRPAQIADDQRAGELRADARHNRDRIVTAAAEAFSERGLDIPMAAIARRAGVGVATLFRRFPTRRELIEEVFSRQFQDCRDLVEEALADPDPWHAFCALLESVRRMQVADRGFSEALVSAASQGGEVDERIVFTEHGISVLAERAKAAGRLRPDFELSDLVVILLAISGIATGPPEFAEAGSQRLLGYLVESFATQPEVERRVLPLAPVAGYSTIIAATRGRDRRR